MVEMAQPNLNDDIINLDTPLPDVQIGEYQYVLDMLSNSNSL